jgi:hypothetical protein
LLKNKERRLKNGFGKNLTPGVDKSFATFLPAAINGNSINTCRTCDTSSVVKIRQAKAIKRIVGSFVMPTELRKLKTYGITQIKMKK